MSHVPHVGQQFNSMQANSARVRQSTNEVLMVAPTAFGFNDQVGCKGSQRFKRCAPAQTIRAARQTTSAILIWITTRLR